MSINKLFWLLMPLLLAGGRPQPETSGSFPADIVWLNCRTGHESGYGHLSITTAGDENMLAIPLKRAGNLILIDAIIDDVQGNLILDTGAEGMVLNSVYFRHGRRTAGYVAGGITGATGSVTRSLAGQVQLGGLTFADVSVNVSDLSHIENARNIKVLGFFGLRLLSGFELVLDLRNNYLELHRVDSRGNRRQAPSNAPVFDISMPVTVLSDVLFVDVEIARRKLTFCLDTGAESNVLSINLPGRILNTVDIFRRSTLRGAGTQGVEVMYGHMNDFSIGGKSLTGMTTIVTNLSAMGSYYERTIDGMLGCDFFEKGVFSINMAARNISIKLYKEDE